MAISWASATVAWPSGDDLWAEGVCDGRIIPEPRGSGGFGYDPAFVPWEEDERGTGRTMAELPADEKHAGALAFSPSS